MQTPRKILRTTGRTIIFLLLALLCSSRWINPEITKHDYLSAYENFRQMGIIKRLFMLPLSQNIFYVLEWLLWVDLIYQASFGILLLLGKRLGGWMMFFWYLVKITICYSPYLMKAPRLPFTYRERFQIVRNFAVLGVSLALTHLYKPRQMQQQRQLKKQ